MYKTLSSQNCVCSMLSSHGANVQKKSNRTYFTHKENVTSDQSALQRENIYEP